jgi:hypothetical protein
VSPAAAAKWRFKWKKFNFFTKKGTKMTENRDPLKKPGDARELSERIAELAAQIRYLEKNIQILTSVVRQPIIIENLYIRKIDAEELQFKLESIDVQDLSGMLNIGVNSKGRFKKKEDK